jgi:serine/threonine-protein kinase
VTVKFTRVPCVVPKLKGKRLNAAKGALISAHCRPGRVTKTYSHGIKRGRVISQEPKPGKRLRAGARVNLTVSRGKKP